MIADEAVLTLLTKKAEKKHCKIIHDYSYINSRVQHVLAEFQKKSAVSFQIRNYMFLEESKKEQILKEHPEETQDLYDAVKEKDFVRLDHTTGFHVGICFITTITRQILKPDEAEREMFEKLRHTFAQMRTRDLIFANYLLGAGTSSRLAVLHPLSSWKMERNKQMRDQKNNPAAQDLGAKIINVVIEHRILQMKKDYHNIQERLNKLHEVTDQLWDKYQYLMDYCAQPFGGDKKFNAMILQKYPAEINNDQDVFMKNFGFYEGCLTAMLFLYEMMNAEDDAKRFEEPLDRRLQYVSQQFPDNHKRLMREQLGNKLAEFLHDEAQEEDE